MSDSEINDDSGMSSKLETLSKGQELAVAVTKPSLGQTPTVKSFSINMGVEHNDPVKGVEVLASLASGLGIMASRPLNESLIASAEFASGETGPGNRPAGQSEVRSETDTSQLSNEGLILASAGLLVGQSGTTANSKAVDAATSNPRTTSIEAAVPGGFASAPPPPASELVITVAPEPFQPAVHETLSVNVEGVGGSINSSGDSNSVSDDGLTGLSSSQQVQTPVIPAPVVPAVTEEPVSGKSTSNGHTPNESPDHVLDPSPDTDELHSTEDFVPSNSPDSAVKITVETPEAFAEVADDGTVMPDKENDLGSDEPEILVVVAVDISTNEDDDSKADDGAKPVVSPTLVAGTITSVSPKDDQAETVDVEKDDVAVEPESEKTDGKSESGNQGIDADNERRHSTETSTDDILESSADDSAAVVTYVTVIISAEEIAPKLAPGVTPETKETTFDETSIDEGVTGSASITRIAPGNSGKVKTYPFNARFALGSGEVSDGKVNGKPDKSGK
ncbi:MAG: hypothetical protein O3B95_07000 [Chloroflexi bacterium]|nr:hypothetical protein [Chloroflexota bacterium]